MPKSKNEINQTEETRSRILEAAAHLFYQDGYARTTTRAIAAEAKVNEVTLFRIFESKEKLFAAIIEHFGGPSISSSIESQFTGDYRTDLFSFGKVFMRYLLERRAFIRLALCEANHFPEMASILSQNPHALRASLTSYLEGHLRSGRLRPLNPEAAAQAFLGMFITYTLILDPETEHISGVNEIDDLIEEFVNIFYIGTIQQENENGRGAITSRRDA